MAMKRKGRKVKHYRRSFYSRGERVRQIIGGLALAVAGLAVAWVVAPYVLNWATHTWYTVVKNRNMTRPASSTTAPLEMAQPEGNSQTSPAPQQDVPKATPAPTPTPAPRNEKGTWASVEPATLKDEATIRAVAEDLKKQGVTYVSVTLKETDGKLAYNSANAIAAANPGKTLIDPGMVASVFAETGLVPVARLAAYRDPVAPYTDRSTGIHYYNTGSMWLDAAKEEGGKPWLNPYNEGAVQYITDLMEEVYGFGFRYILLANVQFPAGESARQNYGETDGLNRAQQLALNIAAWQKQFDGRAVLWYEYAVTSCSQTGNALGNVLPPELGVVRLAIRTTSKDRPKEDKLAEIVQKNQQLGAEYIVVWDGSTAEFQ